MEETEKAAIRAARPVLVNNMETSTVMDLLLSEGVIDEIDEADVNAERTLYDKNRYLLKLLTNKRSKEGVFDSFLRGLNSANQSNLQSMLRKYLEKPKISQSRRKSASDYGQKLISFGVPPKPDVFVHRENLISQVRAAIQKLPTKGGWVLVHGMGGSGKTTLAADALHSPQVFEKFDTIVWRPMGKVDNELLLLKMKLIMQDLTSTTVPSFTMLEEAQNRLREILRERSDSVLIVLDDVWKSDVLKAFNDCGGFFLVTSRNKAVLDRVRGYKQNVKVEEGLSEKQTEDIFCQVLNLESDKLPPEAKEIWIACEGAPLAIVMVASLLKRRPNRWKFYLDKLRKRPDQIRQESDYSYDSLDAVIRVSVDDLDVSLKDKYLKLAVFPKGTVISPEVLVVLWNLEEVEDAEDTIAELANLSLVREFWDESHNCTCYSLHDLQATYLHREDKGKTAHKVLVEAYLKRYGDWHQLPDDKYIMWFIGYHLEKANLVSELVNIFTNLRFVIAKVRQTGTWEVILDYSRYEHHFEHLMKRDDMISFKEFLQRNSFAMSAAEEGQVVDLVQLALCDTQEKCVFRQALELASEQNTKPYWKWTNGIMARSRCYKKHLINWSVPLSALSLSPDGSRVLVGCNDGKVVILSGQTFQRLDTFSVDNQAAVCGAVFTEDGNRCIVCTEDSFQLCALRPSQPRRPSLPAEVIADHENRRMGDWPDVDNPRFTKLESPASADPMMFSTCVAISNFAFIGTRCGIVMQVNLAPLTLRSEKPTHMEAITALSVSRDGRFVASASSDKRVRVYDLEEMEFYATMQFDSAIQDCLFTASKDPTELQLICATSREIRTWRIEDQAESMDPFLSNVKNADFRVLALSSDETRLAAGMSNSVIKLWNFVTREELTELSAVSGIPRALIFISDGSRLLAADDNGTLVTWELSSSCALLDFGKSGLIMAEHLALNWRLAGGLLATQDAHSRHIVCVDVEETCVEKVTAQPLTFTITCVALSPDGTHISVGSCDGDLQEWQRAAHEPSTPSRCSIRMEAGTAVTCLRYVRNGELLAAGLASGDIWLLRANAPRRILKGHSEYISVLCDLNLSSRLLSASYDGYVRFWALDDVADSTTEEEECVHALLCHSDRIICADVSAQQQWLVTGSVNRFAATRDLRELPGNANHMNSVEHKDCVRSARFCPHDDDLVATGDDNGSIRVWHASNPNSSSQWLQPPLDQEQWVVDLAWISKSLLMSVCGVICVWSVESGSLLHTLYPRGSIFSRVAVTNEGRGDKTVAVDSAGTLYLLKRV